MSRDRRKIPRVKQSFCSSQKAFESPSDTDGKDHSKEPDPKVQSTEQTEPSASTSIEQAELSAYTSSGKEAPTTEEVEEDQAQTSPP